MTRTFRSMGCEIVVGGASEEAFAAIVHLFEERDARFSRFRPDSEISRVNASDASMLRVSPAFARAVEAACAAAQVTGGLVSPTIGQAILAAGYDRDFAEIEADGSPIVTTAAPDWRAVRLHKGFLVRPAGTVLDLNGVVKSMAADDAASLLDGPGFVSAGGDIATRDTSVCVSLPGGGTVELEQGGIATSGIDTRRWSRGGRLAHHLIDPRTGLPAQARWTSVTAVGASCLAADIGAKAGFLLGDEGPAWLDAHDGAARFVHDDEIVENARWTRAVDREPAWA